MYLVVFGLSTARWKGNQDGPRLEAHLCHQPAHTEWWTKTERYSLHTTFNYACLSLFQCDTSGHFCHCLHLLRMCFLNCIAEVASLLCCEWISHLETANVTILLLKPFCSILIPKLFRKNNYSPCGSRTVHIAHTCICGRQALQFLLKDSSTSRSSLLSWKSNTCTGKGNTM